MVSFENVGNLQPWRLSRGGPAVLTAPSTTPQFLVAPGTLPADIAFAAGPPKVLARSFATSVPRLNRLHVVKMGSQGFLNFRVGPHVAATLVRGPETWLHLDKAVQLERFSLCRPFLAPKFRIVAVSTANPAQITIEADHGFVAAITNFPVTIFSNSGTPSLNGTKTATRVGATTFTVPVDNTGGNATADGWVKIDDVTVCGFDMIGNNAATDAEVIAEGVLQRNTTRYPALEFSQFGEDKEQEFSIGKTISADQATTYGMLRYMPQGDKLRLTAVHVAPQGANNTAHLEQVHLQPIKFSVTAASSANPVAITVDRAHGYTAGNDFLVYIRNNTGTVSLNGVHRATATSTTAFTIPIDNTSAGAALTGEVWIAATSPATVTICESTGGKAYTFNCDIELAANKGPALIVLKNVDVTAGAELATGYVQGLAIDALDDTKWWVFKEEKTASNSIVFTSLKTVAFADAEAVVVTEAGVCGNMAVRQDLGVADSAAGAAYVQHVIAAGEDTPGVHPLNVALIPASGTEHIVLRADDTGGTGGAAAALACGYNLRER